MAQCPNCSAAVTDDFGLIECASCRAQLLVHIDGTVEYSGAGSDEPRPSAAAPIADRPADAPYDESIFEDDAESGASGSGESDESDESDVDDAPSPAEAGYEDAPYEDLPFEESAYEEPAAEDGFEATADDADVDADANAHADVAPAEAEYDFDAPEPGAPAPDLADPALNLGNASPDLSDVADFGNSDASGGRDGALRYNLLVSGIDTSDVRDAFREALTDRKFLWDIDQIVRSIRDGECHIANVSAVKAHVLISRLRQMQVRVEWEQYAIHQA